jgi:hypothetical protein
MAWMDVADTPHPDEGSPRDPDRQGAGCIVVAGLMLLYLAVSVIARWTRG